MTTDVQRRGGELGFPLLGRLLVALAVVATLLAAAALVRSWEAFDPVAPVLVAWVVTVTAVPVAVRRILATGAMTARTMVALAALVLVVDVVVPLMLAPDLRTTPAAWNWRSGAVLICVLSAYRRPRDVAVVAGLHAGVGVVFAVHAGSVSATATVILVLTCAAPSLAAANYLAVYTEGLRNRQAAVDLHLRTSALRATEKAQRQSVLDEVASIRRQIITLLEAVGEGDRDVAAPDVGREARDLSAALRRELDETRSRGWLLVSGASSGPAGPADPAGPVGSAESVASGRPARRVPGPLVDVLGPATLLDDDARVSVATMVELLSRHDGIRNIVVTIGADPSDGAVTAGRRATGVVEVTVVASGPASAGASVDPAILAAADGLGTAVWHDAEAENLVVEARIPVGSVSARSAATRVDG